LEQWARPVESLELSALRNGGIRWWLPFAIPAALLITALWWPFGFAMSGLIEEWDLRGLGVMSGPFLLVYPDGPIAANLPRPLMPLAFGLADRIAPDSFVGYHIFTIAALLLKSLAFADLTARTIHSRRLGLLAGLLVLVWPADTMQMTLRTLHIHWASALSIAAACVFFRALEGHPRRRVGIYLSATAAVLFMSACGMYEASLAMWPIPLIMFVVTAGIWQGMRGLVRQWRLMLFWLAAPVAYLAFAAWASRTVVTYQSGLVGSQSLASVLVQTWPKLFVVGIPHALIGGWVDAIRIAHTEFVSLAFPLLATLLVLMAATLFLAMSRNQTMQEHPSPGAHLWGRLAGGGLILLIAGYAPFLASISHVAISQRTYLWAAPGAVLVAVALVAVIGSVARPAAWIVAATMTFFGLSSLLFQFHHFAQLSETQKLIARQIVEQLDRNFEGKTLVVQDGTNVAGDTWAFIGDELVYALSYVYGKRIHAVEVCRRDNMEWVRLDGLGRKGNCRREGDTWIFADSPEARAPSGAIAWTPRAERRLTPDQWVAVSIEPDAETSPGIQPGRLTHLRTSDDVVSRRYRGALAAAEEPQWQMFRDPSLSDRFRWTFGDYWNLDRPIPGGGWREGEWIVGTFRQNSVAWKTHEDSHLHFKFKPRAGAYLVDARATAMSSNLRPEDLRMEVNGKAVPVIHTGAVSAGRYLARVPEGLLVSGTNHLILKMRPDPNYYGLSIQFDSIEIRPQSD
jgi:hypothetical protein